MFENHTQKSLILQHFEEKMIQSNTRTDLNFDAKNKILYFFKKKFEFLKKLELKKNFGIFENFGIKKKKKKKTYSFLV